jgi:hypothetical protein
MIEILKVCSKGFLKKVTLEEIVLWPLLTADAPPSVILRRRGWNDEIDIR